MRTRNLKFTLLVFLLSGLLNFGYGQSKLENKKGKAEMNATLSLTEAQYNVLMLSKDKKEIIEILKKDVIQRFDTDISELPKLFENGYGKLKKNTAVVFIRYADKKGQAKKLTYDDFTADDISVNNTKINFTDINQIVFSKSILDDLETNPILKTSSYLLRTNNVILVFIGSASNADSIIMKNNTPFFITSLKDVYKLGTIVLNGSGSGGATKPAFHPTLKDVEFKLVYFSHKSIHPPSEISYIVPVLAKGERNIEPAIDIDEGPFKKGSITIHEKNYLAIEVGINSTLLNRKSFSINQDTISVKLDSAQKNKLKSSITLALTVYPFGRDIDNYPPLWKDLGNFKHHLGVSGGLSLSTDPLKSLFVALNLNISKTFSILLGGMNTSDIRSDQKLTVTNINSASSLQDYFKRSYKTQFFFGVSISPSAALKIFKQ